MTSLHTISRSWHNATWLYEQLAFAAEGDAILLLQDGVLAIQSPISLGSFLAKCEAFGVQVYALKEDCTLRGVENQYAQLQAVDYDGFVSLVEVHDKQVAW
ncbi:MAG: sulfur relay protein TusB/DsrH [Cryomorphaceae bacterium]